MTVRRRVGAIAALQWLVAIAAQPATADDLFVAPTAVVAADSPVASQVGVDVLQAGGNAADAAVAVGLALGVVNPFASGLGGGGFLLFRDASTGDTVVLDFREVAPAGATRDMYVVDGAVDGELSAVGGLAVAVPGEVAGWWAIHQRYGRLPWAEVVEPARRLAAQGFDVHPLLVRRLAAAADRLERFPRLAREFSVGDALATEGDRLARPELADTLGRIAAHGPAGFYQGPVAEDLVASTREAGGILTLDDLADYSVRWLDPVTTRYRGYDVLGMPPPSSGGLVVAQVLGILERFALSRGRYDDPITAHIVMQAFAHAFADRALYLGDPAFWDVPWERFTGSARVDEAWEHYDPVRTHDATVYGPLTTPAPDHGTSHFSIVDADGNAVACTTTINTNFGSGVVGSRSGVVLNNEMDDFSTQPGVPNVFGLVGGEANAIAPGKRPLSSMSPTVVVREGELVGVLGGSGGPMIITETVLGLLQLIDFERDAATTVAAPRYHFQWLPEFVFAEPGDAGSWEADIREFGYEVRVDAHISALQVVWHHANGWQAASDPRKLGAPAGY